MKLFKKLAAAALAAVLALTMVGCGAANGITPRELFNIMSDGMLTEGVTVERSNDMEQLAAKLASNIDKAENKDAEIVERLTDPKVVAAAGIDAKKEIYMVNAVENYAFKSPFITDEEKTEWMFETLTENRDFIGGDSEGADDPDDVIFSAKKWEAGIAAVKIDGKEYYVMVSKPIK